jgi:DNA-binding beta-propeller fold protein YncE
MKRAVILAGVTGAAAVALAASRPADGAARHTARAAGAVQAPRFAVDPLWPKPLPNHWILGSVVGIAVDAHDNVYVVNLPDTFGPRTEIGSGTNPPTGECCTPAPNVLEFDAAGNLVAHWGGTASGDYHWPTSNAGIDVDPAGNVWIGGGGNVDQQMLKFAPGGRFLAAIGRRDTTVHGDAGWVAPPNVGGRMAGPGRIGGATSERSGCGGGAAAPLPATSAATDLFGGAVDVAFDTKANEGYVADGCRDHRIAVIDLGTGAVKRSWGAYGKAPDDAAAAAYTAGATPQQFGEVTCAKLASDGLLYVCDRTNDRVQVFQKNGTFVKEKVLAPTTLGDGSVWDVAFSRDPQQKYLYVADGMNERVYVLDRKTLDVLTTFGDGGRQPGQFLGVSGVAVDSKGNLYTAEAFEGKRLQKFTFKGVGAVSSRALGTLWPSRGTGR